MATLLQSAPSANWHPQKSTIPSLLLVVALRGLVAWGTPPRPTAVRCTILEQVTPPDRSGLASFDPDDPAKPLLIEAF